MIIRQVKPARYQSFCRELAEKADGDPLEACYTAVMRVDGSAYVLRVQPEHRHRIAVLQAVRIERDGDNATRLLVTDGNLLASLLDLLLYQGIYIGEGCTAI